MNTNNLLLNLSDIIPPINEKSKENVNFVPIKRACAFSGSLEILWPKSE